MKKTKAVALATLENQDSSARGDLAANPCAICHERPPVGALTRCVVCLKAATNADRKDRVAAEARVNAREQRQAALEKLGDVFLEFASSEEGLRFLENQHVALMAPSNDPKYLEALRSRDKDREAVANEITPIHHAVLWGRSRIGLTLRDDRNHAKAREVAGKLQQLFETELLYEPDPHDKSTLADRGQKQPPKHVFGREKRSLGNDPEKRSPRKTGSAPGGRK